MIIKKFQAKTEEAALELARKELGSGIVVINVKKVTKKGLFSIFKPQQVEVTVALEEEEKQNFRKAVAKVSEIARQSEAAGNTRSAKTEPEQPAKQGKAEPGPQPEKQRQQEKQRQPEKNTQTIDSRQESAIEEKLSTLQNLLEKQISDVQDKEKDSTEEEKKEDSNVAFFHLLYKMLLDNERNVCQSACGRAGWQCKAGYADRLSAFRCISEDGAEIRADQNDTVGRKRAKACLLHRTDRCRKNNNDRKNRVPPQRCGKEKDRASDSGYLPDRSGRAASYICQYSGSSVPDHLYAAGDQNCDRRLCGI